MELTKEEKIAIKTMRRTHNFICPYCDQIIGIELNVSRYYTTEELTEKLIEKK